MNLAQTLTLLGGICLTSVAAQVEFPGNPTVAPKHFTTRPIGGGIDPGVSVNSGKIENPNVRYVTHIVFFDYRMWSSSEGKPLEGKLIAFEDLVAEAPKGASAPMMPSPPAKPTVTRGGKIRLLVDQKPVEIPLSRLSPSDQEFIAQIQAALDKKISGSTDHPSGKTH